ncbi:bZIP transcription factor 53-like [Amaranthus tricolor]|uniref:bZIP transcription factor 53-like n=1 Tax=Amaranthus tricolor TaxID=29722 RepID=UPI00258C64E0|nr:bZIP transcription factor 53-like [Amaranthus tricolor]
MSQSNDTYDVKNVVVRPTKSSGTSEGSSDFVMDEKKRRRMESNRESARRSRQRKQQHLDELLKQVSALTRENEDIGKKIDEVSGILSKFEAQNKVLNSAKDGLAAKLDSLESLIEVGKIVGGSSSGGNYDDVNSDPMMKPWQLPCPPSMPIYASTSLDRFKF